MGRVLSMGTHRVDVAILKKREGAYYITYSENIRHSWEDI